MNKRKPQVSIIVLNWNGKNDTKLCLDSLSKSVYKDFEVVLVDNGSTDGSQEDIAEFIERFEYDIKFVKNLENLGFTGGNIEGLKHCEGKYIALLNNDVVVDPKWLRYLVESAEKDKKVGVVGSRAYKWGKENPPFNKGNEYYAFQAMDPYLGYIHMVQNGESAKPVDSVSGCAVLIKKEVINKVGFLDSIFFAYYEETDLFARAIRAGYKVYYDSRAYVWHRVTKSTSDSSYFYLYQMARNRAIFAIRNFDDPFYSYFKRAYIREGLRGVVSYFLLQRRNVGRKAKVKSFLWVARNWKMIERQRKKIVSKGKFNDNLSLVKDQSVSVIIPNYNHGEYIGETIESVLSQTVKPLEIIVVDDGSTDNSAEVIKKYPVKVIRQKNQGVVSAKNNGFKLAQGRFVIFLDADDKLKDDAISKYISKYKEDRSVGFVYSDLLYFGYKNNIVKAREFSRKKLRGGNYIHNSSLIKREAFETVGGYDENMGQGYEDWELYISLVELGYRGVRIPEPLLEYRQLSTQDSRNKMSQTVALSLVYNIYDSHKTFFPLWYRLSKKTYYKLYYGADTERNLFLRYPFLITRVILKAATFIKLVATGQLGSVKERIQEKESIWKSRENNK